VISKRRVCTITAMTLPPDMPELPPGRPPEAWPPGSARSFPPPGPPRGAAPPFPPAGPPPNTSGPRGRRLVALLAAAVVAAGVGIGFGVGRATGTTTTRAAVVVPTPVPPMPGMPSAGSAPAAPAPSTGAPLAPNAGAPFGAGQGHGGGPSSGGPFGGGFGAGPAPSDPQAASGLADAIGKQAGTSLQGHAPMTVPASAVRQLAAQHPANATVDRAGNRITFTTPDVAFTVVAVAPGAPDMSFTIGGLTNPELVVPQGATVTVEFVNADTDQAHGWLVTGPMSPVPFRVGQPAIAGAASMPIGDPTSAGDGATTFSFTASATGTFEYACFMPGHAQMGMHGAFTVA